MSITHESHPLVECVRAIRAALDGTLERQATFLPVEAKAALLRELASVRAGVDGLLLRVLAASSDVAEQTGARDAAAWLAAETRLDRQAARADLELAQALDSRWHRVATALSAGALTTEQARVIIRALDEVAGELDAGDLARAEEHLVGQARLFGPRELRRLGQRLVEVVAPERVDELESRRLAAWEEHAATKTRLSIRPVGDGTTRITGVVPDAVGHRLATYLEAFAQPRRQAADADLRPVPYARLLGQAFGDLLERVDPNRLPLHGGDATTVVVTLDVDALRDRVATAGLGFDGDRLTAAQARRLACTARIVPVVLGGRSEILDVGRSARLFTPAQRKALRLRDRRCRAEGCTVPATWCEAHHRRPWSAGGRTDLADGILLCVHHHHRAHDPAYDHVELPDAQIRFCRRRR